MQRHRRARRPAGAQRRRGRRLRRRPGVGARPDDRAAARARDRRRRRRRRQPLRHRRLDAHPPRHRLTCAAASSRAACPAARTRRWCRRRPSPPRDGWVLVMCMKEKFWQRLTELHRPARLWPATRATPASPTRLRQPRRAARRAASRLPHPHHRRVDRAAARPGAVRAGQHRRRGARRRAGRCTATWSSPSSTRSYGTAARSRLPDQDRRRRTRATVPAPPLGADTDAILRDWLGMSADEIDALAPRRGDLERLSPRRHGDTEVRSGSPPCLRASRGEELLTMDFSYTAEEQAFRAELRAWLAANVPREAAAGDARGGGGVSDRAGSGTLYDAGWAAVHWPREYGGRGASLTETAIFQEEMARARAPQMMNRVGINNVGPTLIAHGTEAQRRRYLRQDPQRRGDLVPALLGAQRRLRPRLAAHARRARRATTSSSTARRCGRATRSSPPSASCSRAPIPSAPPHRGISCFIVDMRSPGITIRPLRQLTGSAEFSETFFDNVVVPRANLIGAENDGWKRRDRRPWRTSAAPPSRSRSRCCTRSPSTSSAELLRARGAARRPGAAPALRRARHRGRDHAPAQLPHDDPPGARRAARRRELDRQALLGRPHAAASTALGARRACGPAAPTRRRPLAAAHALVALRQHRRRHQRDPTQHHRPTRCWDCRD